MSESEITRLESRVDELISLCDKIKGENTLLKGRQDILVEERGRLIEKNELARTRVDAMLVRLKSMEHE
jgi:cell division protein ZapB